ncbi:MAG: glucuronate isomerase [Planctomycetes bacterium]|jgi:glucuronate isomerase|nr:glucuronate isomerase [Planctomycetota bacterium]
MIFTDRLTRDLHDEICRIPLIDPHSHINPHAAAAKSLDDILGYHYYTELAHSAGMSQAPLGKEVPPRERVRAILDNLDRIDNTAQYSWFLEIARTFLGFKGDRVGAADCDALCDAAERLMAQPDWEQQVLTRTGVEKIFLTNDFDDPLTGFDTNRYVPCLRTDDLVFHLGNPAVRERLAKATGIDAIDDRQLRDAIARLFHHFTSQGAKACAISLPPDFEPKPVSSYDLTRAMTALIDGSEDLGTKRACAAGVFWMLAEHCREFKLPFDLMIGVNRRVYRTGVFQGQDLFDQRTSLLQYAELFNAFPDVTFPISVLTSSQNQELASYSWIFPNVVTNGHWWYSNIPAYLIPDTRARLQAVPKTKQIGYYSDAYKLEFILPKYNMYRRILAQILADDFVRPGVYSESQAIGLAQLLLRENTQRIFGV